MADTPRDKLEARRRKVQADLAELDKGEAEHDRALIEDTRDALDSDAVKEIIGRLTKNRDGILNPHRRQQVENVITVLTNVPTAMQAYLTEIEGILQQPAPPGGT